VSALPAEPLLLGARGGATHPPSPHPLPPPPGKPPGDPSYSEGSFSIAEARAAVSLAGLASAMRGRRALIYEWHATPMCEGYGVAPHWRVKLTTPAGPQKHTQLMGWDIADGMELQADTLRFPSPEAAVLFCERAGWDYGVDVAPVRALPPTPIALDETSKGNEYAHTILTLGVKAAMAARGPPRKSKEVFAHPARPSATGVSTWANLRHTGYGPDAWRPRKSGPEPQTRAAWTGEGANVGAEWPAAVEVKPPGA